MNNQLLVNNQLLCSIGVLLLALGGIFQNLAIREVGRSLKEVRRDLLEVQLAMLAKQADDQLNKKDNQA